MKRINFKEAWFDFWARIYGFDGLFPRTLIDLTLRPGFAAAEYIKGNRARYYGPVGYFFLMITLLYLAASLLSIDIIDFMKNASKSGLQPEIKEGSGQEKFMQQTIALVSDNLKLVTFIYIPLQAFCARYLFFRKSGLNFLEHTILPFFMQGHIYWVSIISLFVYFFSGSFLPNMISIVIAIGYFSYGYVNLHTYQPKWLAFLKGLGVYVISQLLFALLVAVVVFLVVAFNQEAFEMLKPSNNR